MLACRAVLIDLDGTLVDSAPRILRVWEGWAARNGLDFDRVRSVMYGRRSVDTIRLVAPWLETDREVEALEAEEISDMHGLRVYPGAPELMHHLQDCPHAIVTSGSRRTAEARLRHAQLPIPGILITADDTTFGKPAPDGYLLAAQRLGVDAADCVVIEDSPVGVEAGRAAAMRVVAVGSTHTAEELRGAFVVVPELTDVSARASVDEVEISLTRSAR